MMFEMSFGLNEEEPHSRRVNKSLTEGKATKDLAEKGEDFLSTSEVGDYLIKLICNIYICTK